MKRKFKLADGTVGMLDTDTGEFTPGAPAAAPTMEELRAQHDAAANDAVVPHFPMPGYENVPPEKGLIHEDPIGDVIVGNAVAGGLPKLLEAAGGAIGRSAANAGTRLAERTAQEAAAKAAAKAAIPKAPVSPVRKLGNLVEKAVDLHHPLKPATDLGVRLMEGPVDRVLASRAMRGTGSALSAMGQAPITPGAAYLLYLMGHGGDNDTNGGTNGVR